MGVLEQKLTEFLSGQYQKNFDTATRGQLYEGISHVAMDLLEPVWNRISPGKRACYFSAEFLMGRLIYSNLLNLGLLNELKTLFARPGFDPGMFEEVEDAALGNGGLGRLAACFLDSAATMGLPLDGYGIRYRYGLFRQYFLDGFQMEEADNWTRFGDPWSIRREEDRVRIDFAGESVWAVPYDMPVIGYGAECVNTLRLWQSEPVRPFDFQSFNRQEYDKAVAERTRVEAISDVLYPNDNDYEGKRLRLKQQYFFSSASIQDLLRRYKKEQSGEISGFCRRYAIQLNDTHPAVAIPELLRILVEQEGLSFEMAFSIARETFAYTNHTLMAEALEKWDISLLNSVVPEVYPYIVMMNNALRKEFNEKKTGIKEQEKLFLIKDKQVHMARIAVYGSHSVNGVAEIHSSLLRTNLFKEWHALFPQRFGNKTNGITQRRWLALCNPGLSRFITERIGKGWLTDWEQLIKLRPYADDKASLEQFVQIKRENKERLAGYARMFEYGIELNLDSIFDVQAKRLHEYKRQLLNAFSILDIYFGLKEGRITAFAPMTFLFGAKAAPGYRRAKGIIKYINEIAALINNDPKMKGKLQVLFVQNYNVSYAEKLIPAADISEQISTAGTEASGTGNMKLMLNGSVTLGTWDGANIEIVRQSGEENNYIFGARVEEIAALKDYNPREIYEETPRIRRVLDTLVDGTLDDGGTGMFRELYTSLLRGANWHKPDHYYLLLDFLPYVDAKLAANRDYQNPHAFARKCLLNTASAGIFSSDRTVCQYADEIWRIS